MNLLSVILKALLADGARHHDRRPACDLATPLHRRSLRRNERPRRLLPARQPQSPQQLDESENK